MKKPTFSKLLFSVFFLFENFFKKNFIKTSFCKDFRNLKSPVFEKKSFFRIEYTITVFILAFFLMSSNGVFAQIGTPFKPRLAGGNISVKGDIVLIGNSIVNRVTSLPTPNPKPANWDGNPAVFSPSAPVNNQLFTGTVTNINALTAEANVPFNQRTSGSVNNNDFFIEYSNVDPGTAADGIFSSSSADLNINQTCKKIKFAGLYWSAIYPTDRSTSAGVKYNGSVRSEAFDKIKIKLPGVASSYQDITADDIIFTSKIIPAVPATGNNTATFFESPYVCFKDVTALLNTVKDASGALDANGTYTVANVRATRGMKNGGGAGGWTLVVIYETPTMPSKFISIFDGYASVSTGLDALDIPVSGFQTLPVGFTVNAKLGVAALEGDVGINNDTFQFRNGPPPATYIKDDPTFTKMYDVVNPADNFFNATISEDGVILTNRNPASLNSMGFDIDNFKMPNDNNSVLPNNAREGTLRLTTNGDGYGAFLTTFAVDVIEPNIVLTKKVVNTGGDDITNTIVKRGDVLRYVIGFNNLGSDKAQNVIIEDYLPNIVFFNYPADVLSLPTGVTVQSYNPAVVDPHDGIVKRKIVFSVDNSLVDLVNDQEQFITFQVKVPTDCKDFSDACSNIVNNTAYTIYNGDQNFDNNGVPFGSGSQPPTSKCALGDIATNFIGNIDDCLFDSAYTLCGNSVSISGRNGFQNYTWTGPNGFTASGQTITVTKVGDYFVKADPIAPCIKSLNQNVKVTLFSAADNDALLKYAFNNLPTIEDPYLNRGEIVDCKINGVKMPHIFLCGANDYRDMTITNAAVLSAAWYQLAGASCIASAGSNGGVCANEDLSCSWDLKSNSLNYKADTAGYFKVILKYDKGCSNTLYFNVYKNDLKATESHTNIICTSKGKMIVGGFPPTGYEYSFNLTSYTGVKTYSSLPNANIFTTSIPENYTASIRQIGITNGCVFTVSAQIDLVDFKVNSEVTQPTCSNVNGSIKVTSTTGSSNYIYTLTKVGFGLIDTYGPFPDTNHTFSNQSPGTYSVNVKTADGCDVTVNNIVINSVLKLTATASLTKPLTCVDGEFTIYPVGGTPLTGTPPYYYYKINGAASVINPVIPVTLPLPSGGLYNIEVIDKNNCSATTSITVSTNPKPVYTVVPTNILCYGTNTGAINFNVTSNTSGYILTYSKDGGTTYSNDPLFSSLAPGTYTPVLKYSLSGVDCLDTKPAITITQPADALSASAGVSALAGCGDVLLGIPKNYGKVRITNPQGGVAPYEFSFDNQATWINKNDAYKAPGTYTLYVRDFNKCIFSAPVTLDPEPAAPQIKVDTPVDFNCDGSATSTVTIANPGGITYTYNYYLDGKANTPITNNVFTNVLPGSHPVKVEYKLNTVPTFSNLLFENFGYGEDAESPGINTTFYCWERQVVATQCKSSIKINDGDYSVTANIVDRYGPWVQPGDHTPQTVPATPKGRCLVVNLGDKIATTDVIYKKVINDIIPNQPINFELYAMNLLEKGNGQIDCNLAVALVDATGKEISTFTTGDIPKVNTTATLPIVKIWEKYPKTPITLDPKNNTSLTFIIRSNKIGTNGNDVAIDDIRVYQLPETCLSTQGFNVNVPTGKAFAAQISGKQNVTCNGLNNGEITIAAQNFDAIKGFEYSIDNGVTWSAAMTSSPVTIKTLAGALYKVVVRPVGSSIVACAKPFDVTISVPAALTLSASVTKLATCTTGATITAVGGGGTPAYQYELRKADGVTLVPGFGYSNNGGVFTNVPVGNYTVFVKDANTCEIPVGKAVPVDAAPALTAALATTTDYCYTTANPATLDVTVSGGTGPFTYKLDANAAVSSAATTYSFTNVAPGTHTVLVTDSKNCDDTISSIVIAPQIGLTVSLINDLTCLVDATIDTPVVTNGNGGPYTYTVSHNGGAATAVTSFPYKATTHGTYVFTVTDSRGCPATSNTITVTAKTTPVASPSKTDITCNGLTDGTITITASAGFTSAYTYAIKLSTAPTYTTQITNKFTTLPAGTYDVKVIDSKGCPSAVVQVTIANPTPIAANATVTTTFSCSPTNTKQAATITVAPTGGTGGYTYSYNNGTSFGNNNTLTVNDNGTIQSIKIIVKDANGCLSPMQQIDLAPLNPPTIATITNTPIYCAPAISTTSTVTVPVTAGTGVGTPTYTITSPAAATTNTTGAATGIFTGLTAGTYVFKVTDANGCFATKSHNVPALTPIAVTATKLTDVDCFGNTTGSARFTVSSFSSTGNYNITVSSTPASLPNALSPSGDVRTLTGLVAGTYTFSVTDILTGCTDSKSVTITQPTAALTITNATATNVFCSNDNSQITVTATGGTTNYGYAAVLSGASAPTVFGTSNVITVDTNSGANLVWDVYVRDAKGCTTLPFPVTIINNGSPSVTASVTNQCGASGSSFQIVAVGSGGLAPYTYTINTGLAPSPANTFTVAAGTYTITVRDANGCPATTTVTVNQALTGTAIVTKDITCSLPQEATIKVDVLGGLAPFSYKVDINGAGFGASTSFGGTTFNYTDTGITIGKSYRFEITDANGIPCTALTNVVSTNSTAPVTASEVHVDPTCNGFTDGSIRLTATSGVAPFTYSISGVGGLVSSNVFGGLAAGTYNYIVRDAKGCEASGAIVLNNPAPLQAAISVHDITCNLADTPGSIEITNVIDGQAPYKFTLLDSANNVLNSVNTPSTSYVFPNNLNFGDYYVTVSDAKGCEFKSTKLRINSIPYLTFLPPVISGDCITGATVNLQLDTTFPTAPNYIYSIYGDPSSVQPATASTTATFTGLNFGQTYFFQVIDNNNCSSIVEVKIDALSLIKIDPVTVTNVTCNTSPVSTNGAINFTVSDYTPSVTQLRLEILDQLTNTSLVPPVFKIVPVASLTSITDSFTGLASGAYTLKVEEVDGTKCAQFYPFDITQPIQPLISAVTSNVNATCNSGALVTLTTTGGTGPYQYAYAVAPTVPSSFASGNVLTLDPGVAGTDLNWNIIVRDVNGCTVNVPVTIAKDPVPVIALDVVNKCAPQGTFGINVTATTAGTGAYTISVDGSTFASIPLGLPHTVTGLNSGLHTIIIKDANGCTDTKTITIDEPLVATPAITALPTCADNDGIITMSGTGGPVAGTYTFTILPTFPSVVINNATGVISGLPAGTYTVTMTDTATPTNCTTTAVVTLGAPTPVTFTTATTPALCVGDSNGTIIVTLGAGNNNPSYTYEIIAGPQLAVAQSSNIFTGLQPGTYTVRVNSGRGCRFDDTNVIVAPATPLTANATFPANTTCSTVTVITVTAGGGTGSGYLYNFNGLGYTSDPTYTVNDNGSIQTISYRVKDANGCETLLQTIDVNPLNKPTDLNFVVSTAPTCPAPTSGVTVTATNGVGALTFEIIQFNGAPTALYPPQITAGFAVSAVFNNLPVGDYMFKVTDTFGCTYQESYTVAPVTNITVAASATSNVTCFNAGDGTATFDVANFGGTYNYTFDGTPFANVSTAQLTFTNLTPVLHTLIVTDAITGCQATATVTISQPAAALDFTATATKINCNNDNATITVVATGGTTAYKYAVVPTTAAAPVPTAYGLSNQLTVDTNSGANMVWDVYVMDANGCVDSDSVTILTDANPVITSANHTACVSATGTYDITVIATGFNQPTFQYSADGTNYQPSNVITVNAPGNYTIYVKDANGCPSAGFPITILDPLILTPTVTTPVSCTINNGVISVSTTGGSGNYVYNIDGGAYALVASFPNLASGPHIIGVRDTTTLCTVFATINLQAATPITGFALAKTDVTCNGDSDGTITASMTTPAAGVNDNPVYTYSLTGTTIGGLALTIPATGAPLQTSPIFTGLPASDVNGYTVVVTSARGCTATKTVVVAQPAPIVVPTIVPVQFGCTADNTGNLATITVTGVTGGSDNFLNYEFIKLGTLNTVVQFGASNMYTEANLSGGSYVVNVYDSKGCIGTSTTPIDIAPYIQLDKVNVNVTRPITCAPVTEDIAVSVSAIGGAPANLQFTVQDVTYDNSVPPIATKGTLYNLPPVSIVAGVATFTNLPVGNYEITVRNLDTNCEIIGVHYVNEPSTFDLTIDNVVDIKCFGGTNGSADIRLIDTVPSPVDDAGPFTYTLVDAFGISLPNGTSTAAGTVALPNLAAGTYTFTATLTKTPFCTVSKNFTITGPSESLVISESHSDITCVTGNNDGSISATATGGWSGIYEFRLEETLSASVISDWSTTSSFNGLTAGNYVVKVRDPKGCDDFKTVQLVVPALITFTPIITNATLLCYGDTNASITIPLPIGGSGVYNFALEATYPNGTVTLDGPQPSNVFTNLGAASYKVIVTDTWTCSSVSNTLVITEPTVVSASLVQTSVQTCLNPATLTLSAVGGTGPYTYSADPNFATVLGTFANSTLITVPFTAVGINPLFYVRDVNGCSSTASNSVSVTPLEPLDFKFENDAPFINCLGDRNGQITAMAEGGSGNYIYTLLNSAGNLIVPSPTQPTPGFFTDLAAGSYLMEVKSGDCISARKPITIGEPTSKLNYIPKVTDVLCNGYANGKLEISATGGSPAIVYALSPELSKFVTTSNFENLEVGDYKAIIQDLKGCNYVYDFKIKEPNAIDAKVDVSVPIVQELCAGEKTGAFGIVITPGSGTAPYSTSIDNKNGIYVLNQVLFSGLSGGNHTVYIKDANSCTFELAVALDPSVILNPVATVSNECVNDLPANKVTVTIDPSNIPADVTYSLDAVGVEQNSNVFNNLTPGDHYIMVHHKNGCDDATPVFPIDKIDPLAITIDLGGLNEIVATVTGGSSVYQFTVNGVSIGSNNKYIYFKSGNYTVTVTDSNGCVASATKYFEFIDIIIPPIFTPTGDGTNDSWKPTNTENYPDIKFVVYDRYGRVVGTFGAGQSWDGKYNGTELPMGDYWYVLKLRHNQDDREFMGHFTLYR
ncbi:T9SS type B sorting domain-containing protein [Flavobacterium praedii]|uniref:T9SS type B sorting domain-containing protein n=1 Tax=Flavobacterium praedii TaxID=3002900 RepID=UPI002481FB04|nr:T9SS type B sorting domain-containing protein [Flavobacterium praedii]